MSKAGGLCVAVFILSLACVSSSAKIIHIDINGPNDPGTGTFEDPFRKIQAGIDSAVNGDTVQVQPGIYTGSGNYDLDPNGKSITICSTEPNNSDVVESTIIDPNQAGRGFYFHNAEESNCIVSGFTIKDANTSGEGAGVFCNNSSPTITNCIITNSSAGLYGGGISLYDSNSQLIGCTINNNSATDGGGIECYLSRVPKLINCIIINNNASGNGGGIDCLESNLIIRDCVIKNNKATLYGGAIFCGSSNPEVTGSIISSNSALDGGALECWSGTAIFQNCIISNNTALNSGGAIDCYWEGQAELHNCTVVTNSAGTGGALRCVDEGKVTIQNSIIWSNHAAKGAQIAIESSPFCTSEVIISYSDVQDSILAVHVDPCSILIWGSGNIDADPCFASFDPNGDPNLWDLHLKSSDGRWNPTFYKIDLNNDGIINLVDFARLVGVWLEQDGNLPENIDNIGIIDEADLELFTQYYLANSHKDGWVSDSSTSPCVDAGEPNSDWTSEPWPNGKRINMGVYGGTNQASKNGNSSDFDVSGAVNFEDFAALAGKWMDEGEFIEDLSGNAVIDHTDLGEFAENWLWRKD